MSQTIFCDGSGWNGSISKICVAFSFDDFEIIELYEDYTNNEMEYLSFIAAMFKAQKGASIYGDSKLVVNQIKGNWKCKKDHLQFYLNIARSLMQQKNLNLGWIPRDHNVAGLIFEGKRK